MEPIDWLRVPPLSALRAFEATARTGSFSAAAAALNVTHAAIAQQVRSLETRLGCALVTRAGRGVVLSDEGLVLARACNAGFSAIEGAVRDLRDAQAGSALSVTMTPVFADKWLMPRIKGFWSSHPEIALTLRPDYRVVDLRRERVDVGIRFGRGKWPGVDAEYLTSARFLVVAAPSLLTAGTDLTSAELEAMPWITEARWNEPLAWLRDQQIDLGDRPTLDLPNEELAISAARQGMGLYVATAALVEEDLKSGALVALRDPKDQDPGYYVVTPAGPQKPAVRQFVRWLRTNV